jgi:hypothetical protein
MSKQNWFNSLNDSLESEDLLESWDISFSPINYGETKSWTWEDGTKYGHFITIYRDDQGRYERPVHYKR